MSLHAISVDVEEHFQVEAFADVVPSADWPSQPSRVMDNTLRVLDLFAEFGVRGTFFIVGWVAERHPDLVQRIASAGHEVGCHSYLHSHICRLQRQQFRQDTRRALDTIGSAAGLPVRGYRAPTFSVTPNSLWALEILYEEGVKYDSSVFPIRHDLYGMPMAPRRPFRWILPNGGDLLEFPASTVQLGGLRLPAAGGGYLRILPERYTHWAIRRLEREQTNAMVYFHPWELDPAQPRIAAPWRSRLRHYTYLHRFDSRLRRILQQFRFASVDEVLQEFAAAGNISDWPVAAALSAARQESWAQA